MNKNMRTSTFTMKWRNICRIKTIRHPIRTQRSWKRFKMTWISSKTWPLTRCQKDLDVSKVQLKSTRFTREWKQVQPWIKTLVSKVAYFNKTKTWKRCKLGRQSKIWWLVASYKSSTTIQSASSTFWTSKKGQSLPKTSFLTQWIARIVSNLKGRMIISKLAQVNL